MRRVPNKGFIASEVANLAAKSFSEANTISRRAPIAPKYRKNIITVGKLATKIIKVKKGCNPYKNMSKIIKNAVIWKLDANKVMVINFSLFFLSKKCIARETKLIAMNWRIDPAYQGSTDNTNDTASKLRVE